MEPPVHPDEEVTIEITGLAAAGDGVGRHQGFAVFVPYAVPGDRLRVRVREVGSRHARAEIVSVVEPGAARVEARCRVFGRCGGCLWQHVAYAEQLARKRRIVVDALERVAHLKGIPVHPTLGMDDPWSYRNKIALPFTAGAAGMQAGFYERGTHRVVDLPAEGCAIHHPTLNRIAGAVLDLVREQGLSAYDEATGEGLLRHLVARVAVATGEALAALVINGESLPGEREMAARLMARAPDLVGVVKNSNRARTNVIWGPVTATLAGRPYVNEKLDGLLFQVSAPSFFQVNPAQAARLYAVALRYAGVRGGDTVVDCDTVIDCYCGTGALALLAARSARRVYGIEEAPAAVADAGRNAMLNGIENVRFIRGRVEEVLHELTAERLRADVILLDPPRKGCDRRVLEACRLSAPGRLVYVSCNPATLARDLEFLTGPGAGVSFRVREVQPVDLFPQTAHVECAASLEPAG